MTRVGSLKFANYAPHILLAPFLIGASCPIKPCKSGEVFNPVTLTCVKPTPTESPTATPTEVSPTPTTPSETPSPTAIPTSVPTSTPSPSPTPSTSPTATAAPSPTAAVCQISDSYSVPAAPPCKRGFVDVNGFCFAQSADCGNSNWSCPNRVGLDMRNGYLWRVGRELIEGDGPHDIRNYIDPFCRTWHPDRQTLRGDWTYKGICEPLCGTQPAPTPTLNPRTTPPPTAPPPVGGLPPRPSDFRLNFVNGCNKLSHPSRRDGRVCGVCDATYRFIGTLASGERWGNACDADHYICAIDPRHCKDNPQDIPSHLKTGELCGLRDWDSPLGVDFRISAIGGVVNWKPSNDNPFQADVCADSGTELLVTACKPEGARTHDGILIPGGSGCQSKSFVVN